MRPIAKIQGLFVIYYFCKCRFVRSRDEKKGIKPDNTHKKGTAKSQRASMSKTGPRQRGLQKLQARIEAISANNMIFATHSI